MSAMPDQKSNKWLWLAILFGGAALAVLLFLGTWQVQRLAWKNDLLATIDQRTKQAPVSLADVIAKQDAGEPIEYFPVMLEGVFDHTNEQHFFATFGGNSGYYIYTPLRLSDGKIIFVNRGFVPFDKKEPSSRPETLIQGNQQIIGLARSAPRAKAGWVVPENDRVKNVFHWKDLDAMRQRAGFSEAEIVPIFIDQNNNADRKTLPIGGVTIIDLPNNHLQYAITWYGLAMTLVGVLGFWIFRQTRGR